MAERLKNGVLHFADFKSPCRGNFINSLEALRKATEKQGRRVVYLFPAATAQRDWAQELEKQTDVYYLTDSFVKNVFLVRRIIKKHSIGIIHSHFYKLPYLLTFDLASAFTGVKQVVHLHCALHIHTGAGRPVERAILNGKTFIGCSEKLTADAKKFYPLNAAFTAKNAIYFPRLNSYEPVTKSELCLSESAKTLMMFGFLYEVKGVDLALEAVSGLIGAGRDLQLILILTSHVDEIKAKITARFGQVPQWLHLLPPRNDIAAYYTLCNAFLAPSRSEGLPYSPLEAAYLKVPVVLSDIPAHRSLSLEAGYYFESENIDDFKRQIISALDSPPQGDVLDEQAQKISADYRLSVWTDTVTNIYNEL